MTSPSKSEDNDARYESHSADSGGKESNNAHTVMQIERTRTPFYFPRTKDAINENNKMIQEGLQNSNRLIQLLMSMAKLSIYLTSTIQSSLG